MSFKRLFTWCCNDAPVQQRAQQHNAFSLTSSCVDLNSAASGAQSLPKMISVHLTSPMEPYPSQPHRKNKLNVNVALVKICP